MKVIALNEFYGLLLEEFCQKAQEAGFENNSSLTKMKFNGLYDLDDPTQFWAVIHENKIITVSGCHRIKDSNGNLTGMRCLFRSATLPAYNKLLPMLSRNHMNSLPFSLLLPCQIEWGLKMAVKNFYIYTHSCSNEPNNIMKRTHKALELLAKKGLLENCGEELYYYTLQTKWKINLDQYFSALKTFHNTRLKLNLAIDKEYLDLIERGFSK